MAKRMSTVVKKKIFIVPASKKKLKVETTHYKN